MMDGGNEEDLFNSPGLLSPVQPSMHACQTSSARKICFVGSGQCGRMDGWMDGCTSRGRTRDGEWVKW